MYLHTKRVSSGANFCHVAHFLISTILYTHCGYTYTEITIHNFKQSEKLQLYSSSCLLLTTGVTMASDVKYHSMTQNITVGSTNKLGCFLLVYRYFHRKQIMIIMTIISMMTKTTMTMIKMIIEIIMMIKIIIMIVILIITITIMIKTIITTMTNKIGDVDGDVLLCPLLCCLMPSINHWYLCRV